MRNGADWPSAAIADTANGFWVRVLCAAAGVALLSALAPLSDLFGVTALMLAFLVAGTLAWRTPAVAAPLPPSSAGALGGRSGPPPVRARHRSGRHAHHHAL